MKTFSSLLNFELCGNVAYSNIKIYIFFKLASLITIRKEDLQSYVPSLAKHLRNSIFSPFRNQKASACFLPSPGSN